MRYFIEFSFLGKNYHGWQIQPNAISIQEIMQNCISTILRKKIEVVSAGRTDAGVHASQIYAHFDLNTQLENNFKHKLNSILPNDIVVYNIFRVKDNLHARFDAVSRSYQYRIITSRNPFFLDTTYFLPQKNIDIILMNKACDILLDYNDFECFSKVKTDVFTFNCSITEAKWVKKANELNFYISANRFLRNMVRSIVGTLLNVGYKKTSLIDFKKIIESKDRCKAGMSVPAKGLFLTKVKYNLKSID